MRRLPVSALAVALALLLPGAASALSVVPDPLAFNISVPGQGNIVGTVDFLGAQTGVPAGGVVLDGAPQPTDVTLVFTISLDPSSSPTLPLLSLDVTPFHTPSATTYLPTGDGTIAGAGVDVTSSGIIGGFSLASGVGPGQTSDPFFISLSPSDLRPATESTSSPSHGIWATSRSFPSRRRFPSRRWA